MLSQSKYIGVFAAAVAILSVSIMSGVIASLINPPYHHSNYEITIDCAIPEVPESVPTLKKIRVPVSRETAEAIAKDVFNFSEIRQAWESEDGRLGFSDIGKSIVFEGLYDIYYDCRAKEALTDWSEEEAKEAAEGLVARLEAYWEMPTAVGHSLEDLSPQYDGLNMSLPLVGVIAHYSQSYQGIGVEGHGAYFDISLADGKVVYANIHKPIVTLEGSDDVTVTPMEAVRKALSRESAWKELGFHDCKYRPHRGKVNITSIRLVYYADDIKGSTHITPVYYIEGLIEGIENNPQYPNPRRLIEVVFATERRPSCQG